MPGIFGFVANRRRAGNNQPMPIQFHCHHCNKPVQAPDTAAGKSAKCPGCGTTTTVPRPQHQAAAPPPPPIVSPPQPMGSATISCPFCGEDIKPTAKKCKHCGEWLDKVSGREGTGYVERGSAEARSVTRGLKEKEYQDTMLGCGGFLALCLSVGAGIVLHWIIGVVIFFVTFGLLSRWYYKE